MNYDSPPGRSTASSSSTGCAIRSACRCRRRPKFKTWRFGYEYDFLYKSRGFLGVLLDVKVTDVNVGLNSPIGDEFAKALAPIPTIGWPAAIYPAKNLALNGEIGYFRIPESISEDHRGRYLDWDVNASSTHKNFGIQAGYRTIDVFYKVRTTPAR